MTGFPKPLPRAVKKDAARSKRGATERAVNREVDRRDGRQCRCCERNGNPEATTTLGRIHRAHIVDASRGGTYTAENLCSLCWICHSLEHAKRIWFVGTDANDMTLGFEMSADIARLVFDARPQPSLIVIVDAI